MGKGALHLKTTKISTFQGGDDDVDFSEIRKIDGAVADAIVAELERQQHNIELIASENITFPKVVRSIDPDLDGEAIRVISIMPK